MSGHESVVPPSIQELLRDPSVVATVTPEQVPGLLLAIASQMISLAAVQTALAARISGVPAKASSDRPTEELLTAEEFAERVHCSKDFVLDRYRAGEIPGAGRSGRRVVFPASSVPLFVRGAA